MNIDEKIDLLRRSNFMPVDKKSETIAVRHCCNIHYHRCLVLEGVRRAVLRNLGSSDETDSNSIINPGAVGLFSQKYTTPFEVIEADLTGICRDMHRIFIDSLWDVYLCLLHEELEAYRRLVKRNSNFRYAPLTDFLNCNKDLLAHLRELRDSVLHPQNRTSFQDALDGIFSSEDRQREPLPKLIIDAQFLIDAHTVRFWYWDVAGLVPCPLGGGLEHRPGHAAGRGLGLEGVLGAVGEAGGDGAHGGRGVGERPGDACGGPPGRRARCRWSSEGGGPGDGAGKGHEAGLQVRGAQRQDPEGEYLSKLAHELMDIQ